MIFEYAGETVFRDHGNFKIGARLLQQMQSRGGQNTIAERAQPYDNDAACGPSRPIISVCVDTRNSYSSTVASSISMTGISSRIG